jgi:hypothetical protein
MVLHSVRYMLALATCLLLQAACDGSPVLTVCGEPGPNPRCPLHTCSLTCDEPTEQLQCCDSVEASEERAICYAQVHGLAPGIHECAAVPSNYFVEPGPDVDQWTVTNILVTPCTGAGLSGETMSIDFSTPRWSQRGSYNKTVVGGCEWFEAIP